MARTSELSYNIDFFGIQPRWDIDEANISDAYPNIQPRNQWASQSCIPDPFKMSPANEMSF